MGILNVTPDSFSDGGQFQNINLASAHAIKMIENGAHIIDIGGESTRPGSDPVSEEEECRRVLPVIKEVRKRNSDVLISIDTYKSKVAERAINVGANMINDISGLTFDPYMIDLLSANSIPVVIMHKKGTPKDMQQNPNYNNLIEELISFFVKQCKYAEYKGVKKENIILDPGIGFGKSFDDNFSIIKNLDKICKLGYPVMVGPSRKAFIGADLNLSTGDRLEGTLAAITCSVLNGAKIVRVHDVKETYRAINIIEKIMA